MRQAIRGISGPGCRMPGKEQGTGVAAMGPQAQVPCSLPLTASRAEKTVASARWSERSRNFHVLAVRPID
jgi:hypothetical protein